MKKRHVLAGALALALAPFAPLAHADTWPSRPLRLIVPFPPGGSADLFARLIAVELAPSLDQPMVVDNRPGAGGNVGAREVANAAHAEVRKALQSEKMQGQYRELGAYAQPFSSAEFGAFVDRELRKWSEVIQVSDARVD